MGSKERIAKNNCYSSRIFSDQVKSENLLHTKNSSPAGILPAHSMILLQSPTTLKMRWPVVSSPHFPLSFTLTSHSHSHPTTTRQHSTTRRTNTPTRIHQSTSTTSHSNRRQKKEFTLRITNNKRVNISSSTTSSQQRPRRKVFDGAAKHQHFSSPTYQCNSTYTI